MKQNQFLVKLFTIIVLISVVAVVNAATTVTGLVCEYLENPVGIDVQKPRLSWKINATENNVLQSAYEIKVTEQSGNGKTIWNSGKVASGQSVNVAMAGPQNGANRLFGRWALQARNSGKPTGLPWKRKRK